MFGEINGVPPIPKETARTAKAIFGSRNFYIQVGEGLEAALTNNTVKGSSTTGIARPILSLVTFFQALEGLTDTQAIDGIRTRIDWKYALHLGIHPPSIQYNALCELRRRIIKSPMLQREFQRLIDWLITLNPPVNDLFQDFHHLELLVFVCSINRLSQTYKAMQHTLETLARKYPDWLRKTAMPHWYGRYNGMINGFDSTAPLHTQETALREVSTDIRHLLDEIHGSGMPQLREVQEVNLLEHVWEMQFDNRDEQMNDNRKSARLIDCEFCIHQGQTKEVSQINT